LARGSAPRGQHEIPHDYVGTELDLSRALAWLTSENAHRPVAERLLPIALLRKAVAGAVRAGPEVNGLFVDGAFRASDAVHIGFAVSLRQGGIVLVSRERAAAGFAAPS
jgi:pyruvate dehydrogenase E2 component (dihydrolipoamide acetyltransferase)